MASADLQHDLNLTIAHVVGQGVATMAFLRISLQSGKGQG